MPNSPKRRLLRSEEPDPEWMRRKLGECYGPLIREPLPEAFVKLLEKLEAENAEKEKQRNG